MTPRSGKARKPLLEVWPNVGFSTAGGATVAKSADDGAKAKDSRWLKTIPKYHTGGACRPNSRDRETLQGGGRNLTLDDKKHSVAEAKTPAAGAVKLIL